MASNNTSTKSAIQKKAVDSNAKTYWESFFSQGYGALMVKSIKKRVKAALVAESMIKAKRQAATGKQSIPQSKIASGEVAGLSHFVTEAGLTMEGVFSGKDTENRRVAKVFKASFDKAGNLTAFRSIDAP